MELNSETLIGDIVAKNYRSAQVFKKHEIDFCCQGNRSISSACKTLGISTNDLIEELTNLSEKVKEEENYQEWEIDFLSDYIYDKHHQYVESKIPVIKEYLSKISQVHGDNHPELYEIETLFKESAGELSMHMKKEELLLFPYFKKLAKASRGIEINSTLSFTSVESPIAMMHKEHDDEGDRFRKISVLSNQYTPPVDACNSYKVAFLLLKEFEEDLHKHIHLENNILFKKAIVIENSLN